MSKGLFAPSAYQPTLTRPSAIAGGLLIWLNANPGLASVQVSSARIGVVKASQNGSGDDFSLRFARLCGEAFVESSGYALLDGLVRARVVIVLDVFLDNTVQLAMMQDEHMVQAFPFQAADEALADRVGLGCSNWCLEHLDIRAIGNTRKQRAVLVVPIAD